MKKIMVILGLLLTSCVTREDAVFLKNAQLHSMKLREHFLGNLSVDVSYLIAETSAFSYELQVRKFDKLATKFNSYLDVLMYGNKTLHESVIDVQELIKFGVNPSDYKYCLNI